MQNSRLAPMRAEGGEEGERRKERRKTGALLRRLIERALRALGGPKPSEGVCLEIRGLWIAVKRRESRHGATLRADMLRT